MSVSTEFLTIQEEICKLLCVKSFRKSKLFDGLKLAKGFTSQSWVQFYHDFLYIIGQGIRSSLLIDYPVPEWEDLINFIEILKKSTILNNNNNAEKFKFEIISIHLDDFLYFLSNKTVLLERIQIDLSNNFENYLFIDVSQKLNQPKYCETQDYHKNQLKLILEYLAEKLKSGSKEILLDKDLEVILKGNRIYLPILSGWFCEYPIIYCNSSRYTQCSQCPSGDNCNDLDTDWNENSLSSIELQRYSVRQCNISTPYQSLQLPKLLLSFTYPVFLETSHKDILDSILNKFQKSLLNRFNQCSNESQFKLTNQLEFNIEKLSNDISNIRL
ncbi:hypothetical protein DLAC_05678 [Tieghemostelium lacteum]|uniref:Uncharacterized protein n=1 Tax=Tieghemostelium lacteum TaxID=361077 RepID=A0A151ZGL9_TIELA|nr:hypothetical protein DLAC_05678 [Tieghemostelium lacteum]|eukprot:KYQ93067.1 hypothetical protein DLAC_05678 [Tieghemostelium lacteum]